MRLEEIQAQRLAAARSRGEHVRRRRVIALSAVVLALAAVVFVVTSSGRSTGGSRPAANAVTHPRGGSGTASRTHRGSTVTGRPTGKPGTTPVPVLVYHVIAPPPPGAASPDLYVPAAEFDAQMQALKAAGWHPVTLDQLKAYWTRGVPLGAGKPIVLTFDNGYHSQYAGALPILRKLGWVGVENLQLAGLPPSQGGLSDAEVRGLISAGWELDTQGISPADLITLDATALSQQVAGARQTLRHRYGVPVNWFCYPSGHYNGVVVAAVQAAGFVGSTTVIPGWASPSSDPYRLPRLRVLAGTSPAALLAQIASAEHDAPPPASYSGA
jgi:peptidoglycan/xylan/chitin deacetylase (PgdA/CDA1 family)